MLECQRRGELIIFFFNFFSRLFKAEKQIIFFNQTCQCILWNIIEKPIIPNYIYVEVNIIDFITHRREIKIIKKKSVEIKPYRNIVA